MVVSRFRTITLYIIFIMIIMLCPRVYALEVDVTSSITSPETSGTGKYRGTEILNTGGQFTYNVRTRYQGRLSRIIYNLPLPSELGDCFTTNATYTVTMYMETNDWNNKFGSVKVRPYSSSSTNWSSGNVTYVSYKKIYFTFKIPSSDTTCYDFVWVDLPSSNLSTTGITQVSNWNLNKITLTDPTISGGSSSGGSGSIPTPTPDSSQAIINNQNQNTQDIMENDDQNTQDIISSIQETTQQVSDTITNVFTNNCTNLFDFPFNQSQPFSITATQNDYTLQTNYLINLDSSQTYYFSFKSNKPYGASENSDSVEAFFLKDGGYSTYFHLDGLSGTFTPPQSGIYVLRLDCNKSGETCIYYDFMISTSSQTYCPYGSIESNKIDFWGDNIDQQLESLNNTMKDDNISNGVGSNFFNNFDTDDNGGISAIVTKPLMIIDNLLTNNGQCTNLYLPEFMGVSNAYMPSGCILWNNATTTMISLWNIFVCGLGSYFILKDLFRIIENLKNPDDDRVEVIDL